MLLAPENGYEQGEALGLMDYGDFFFQIKRTGINISLPVTKIVNITVTLRYFGKITTHP